jgi:hypothetical protein
MRRLPGLICITALFLVTAACSGGGGGGTSSTSTSQDSTTVEKLTVSSTVPAQSQANVAPNTIISAVFSNPMQTSGENYENFVVIDGTRIVPGTFSCLGNSAVFRPFTPFTKNTTYTVTIKKDIKDVNGSGMSNDLTWSFTTGAVADTTPPHVTASNPSDNSIGISANNSILITFSEPVDPATVNTTTLTVSGPGGPVAGTLTTNGINATFLPDVKFDYLTPYTITVNQGVKDLAGNPLNASTVIKFTTGEPPGAASTQVVFATAINSYSIKLNWSAVSGASGYNIYFANSAGVTTSSPDKIANVSGTSYTHSGIPSNTTHYYRVTAIKNGIEGVAASEVSAKTFDSVRESEPNDSTATASAINIGGLDMRGQLSSVADIDNFKFTSNGGVVSFTLTPAVKAVAGSNEVARIVAQDGTIVTSLILSESADPITLSGATLAGVNYYVRIVSDIEGHFFTQDYIISSAYDPTMKREFEPNNSMATATPIVLDGSAVRGQLSSLEDIDYYKITSTGGVVSFTIAPSTKVAVGSSVKTSIVAQDGTVISSKTLDENSDPITLSGFSTNGNTYYLRIEKTDDDKFFNQDYIITGH